MKTLIVSYSFSGNNRELARHLERRLAADWYEIVERKPRTGWTILLDVLFHRYPAIMPPNIPWAAYGRTILVAPIWNGRIASPLCSFLLLERRHLGSYSFITLCGGGGNKKVAAQLTRLVHHEPEAVLELPVNDLLPAEKKNKLRYTSGYKVGPDDLALFDPALDAIIKPALPV